MKSRGTSSLLVVMVKGPVTNQKSVFFMYLLSKSVSASGGLLASLAASLLICKFCM